jgi:3-methyladenine DNA glycosylase AlkC
MSTLKVETKRKGATSVKNIPPDILNKLNAGEIETVNLMEWLAIDQTTLLRHFLSKTHREKYLTPTLNAVALLKKQTVNTVNEAIGQTIYQQAQLFKDQEIISLMRENSADVVRCWAAYATVQSDFLSMTELLEKIKPFAADSHFGVREISWLTVRTHISTHLDESISILNRWSDSADANIRRFASEATRPRGVWCAHLDVLKKNPALAISILEPLKSDASQYVRDSVGNWLNDASKSQPDYVLNLCKTWETVSSTPETKYIIKKSLRSIQK